MRINGTFEVTAGLSNPSSAELKEGFALQDAAEILDKLSSLEITQWNYKHRPEEKHIGPVAEDFFALFGLGNGDTHISTIDADGVMMIAIQALKEENEMLRSRLAKEEERNAHQDELIREILERLD